MPTVSNIAITKLNDSSLSSSTRPSSVSEAVPAGRLKTAWKDSLRSKLKSATSSPLPSRRWVIALAIACVVALSASGYLGWVALASSKIAGCGGGRLFNCGHVISSRWSLWMGIPVSLMAVGLYVGMACSLFLGACTKFSNPMRHIGWAITSILAIAAGLSGIWFVSLQVFVLNHLCSYCLVAHACGIIAASIVLWKRPIGFTGMKAVSLVSLAGVAVMIGGQLLGEDPKTFRIEQFEAPAADVEIFEFEAPDAPPSNSAAIAPGKSTSMTLPSFDGLFSSQSVAAIFSPTFVFTAQVSQPNQEKAVTNQSKQPVVRRMVPINGGTISLDAAQWPVCGSHTAKYIFVEMFDYSCPHCRHTHVAIKKASEQLNGDLAVVVLPIPLSAACNGTIQVTDPKFAESCEIAKLAVAVWRIDAAKFTDFHHWMFSTEEAPTFAKAKAHADTLVNVEALNKELASPVPGQYIAKTVELYKGAGSGNVPKLIFPGTTVVGEYTSSQGLVEIIKQQTK